MLEQEMKLEADKVKELKAGHERIVKENANFFCLHKRILGFILDFIVNQPTTFILYFCFAAWDQNLDITRKRATWNRYVNINKYISRTLVHMTTDTVDFMKNVDHFCNRCSIFVESFTWIPLSFVMNIPISHLGFYTHLHTDKGNTGTTLITRRIDLCAHNSYVSFKHIDN